MGLFDRVRRIAARHPHRTDGLIAAVLCALALLSLWVNWSTERPGSPLKMVILTVLLLAPLAWRRRFPLATLAVMTPILIMLLVSDAPHVEWIVNAWWIALYSTGAYGTGRRRDLVRAVAIVAVAGQIVHEIFFSDLPGFEGNRL